MLKRLIEEQNKKIEEQNKRIEALNEKVRLLDQRDQEKLNGQGGRGDQGILSRVFALDEFVHEWD